MYSYYPTLKTDEIGPHYKQWNDDICGTNHSPIASVKGVFNTPSPRSYYFKPDLSYKKINSITVCFSYKVIPVGQSTGLFSYIDVSLCKSTRENVVTSKKVPGTVHGYDSVLRHEVRFEEVNGQPISLDLLSNLIVKVSFSSNSASECLLKLSDLYIKVDDGDLSLPVKITTDNTIVPYGNSFQVSFTVNNTEKIDFSNRRVLIEFSNNFLYDYTVKEEGKIVSLTGDLLVWEPGINREITHRELILNFKAVQSGIGSIKIISLETTDQILIEVKDYSSILVDTPPSNIKEGESFDLEIHAKSPINYSEHREVIIDINGNVKLKDDSNPDITFDSDGQTIILEPEIYKEVDEESIVQSEWYRYYWKPELSSKTYSDLIAKIKNNGILGSINYRVIKSNQVVKSGFVKVLPLIQGGPTVAGFVLGNKELSKLGDTCQYNVEFPLYVEDDGYDEGGEHKDWYPDGIPDLGNNHRFGVYNKDPYTTHEDYTGSTVEWNAYNMKHESLDSMSTFLLPSADDSYYLTPYTWNIDLNKKCSFSFQYLHTHIDNEVILPFDMENKFIEFKFTNFGIKYPFSELGIPEENCDVKFILEKTETGKHNIHVYINNNRTYLVEQIELGDNVQFGFSSKLIRNYDTTIHFNNFLIREDLDKSFTDNELIEYAFKSLEFEDYSDHVLSVNKWIRIKDSFVYNEGCPVVVLLLGENSKGNVDGVRLKFTSPFISEKIDRPFDEEEPNFVEPFRELIGYNVPGAVSGDSNEFLLYDFEPPNLYNNPSVLINGIQLDFDYIGENSTVICTLSSGEMFGSRSIYLEPFKNDDGENSDFIKHGVIGGLNDLFGLNTELSLSDIHDLKVIIKIITEAQSATSPSVLSVMNFNLTVYYMEVDKNEPYCVIDNIDTRQLGMFIRDIKVPAGPNSKVKMLTVEGTDTNIPYNMSVSAKTINVEFDIHTDNLTDSTVWLRNITKMFTNKRDINNRPILKKIYFSFYPSEYYEYLLQSSIDSKIFITDYICSVKLTIPEGCSYSNEIKNTGSMGTNNGLLAVNPIIYVKSLTDSTISITKEENDITQEFRVSDKDLTDKFGPDDYIEINCQDRLCRLYKYDVSTQSYNSKDITNAVNYGSDWFTIIEDYSFKATGGKVSRVIFRERW